MSREIECRGGQICDCYSCPNPEGKVHVITFSFLGEETYKRIKEMGWEAINCRNPIRYMKICTQDFLDKTIQCLTDSDDMEIESVWPEK